MRGIRLRQTLLWDSNSRRIIFSLTIKKEMFPLKLNIISIQVPYPGAAPQEVEEGVIVRVEESIEDLQGIKKSLLLPVKV